MKIVQEVEIQIFWLSKHVLISFCMFWTILHVYTIFFKNVFSAKKSMKEIDLFHMMSSDVVISGPKVTIYAIKLTS